MVIIHTRAPPAEEVDDTLKLPFEQRCKSRLRTTLVSGEEVGLFLERGTILRGGDCLAADDGRVVRVQSAAEKLMEVRAKDAESLARAAYHLGNFLGRSNPSPARTPPVITSTPARPSTPA